MLAGAIFGIALFLVFTNDTERPEAEEPVQPTTSTTDDGSEEEEADEEMTEVAPPAGGTTSPEEDPDPAPASDPAPAPAPTPQPTPPPPAPQVKTFELTGASFAFSQSEIRVKQGDTVRIIFTSTGSFHDWVVDTFGAATAQVSMGGTSEVTFIASAKGTFEYYCSVGNHRAMGMTGTLIVE